jgi:ethanolamine-phosphate phospho-lyase
MEVLQQFIEDNYDLEQVTLKRLDGYANENYLVNDGHDKYILKTYPFSKETHDQAVAESKILVYLSQRFDGDTPEPVRSGQRRYVLRADIEGESKTIRLLTFVSGQFLGDVERTDELLGSLGAFLGQLDESLSHIHNAVISSRRIKWDNQHLSMVEPYVMDIDDPGRRKIVLYYMQQFRERVLNHENRLRRCVIHNDANEWNLLSKNGCISGIIDFGDIVESYRINELSVAITYAIMGLEDPIAKAAVIVKAYNEYSPLDTIEVDLLYYLIAARLCISVCNSAHSKKNNPDNEYISVSEQGAWDLLHLWLTINPLEAQNSFRTAIGQMPEKAETIESLVEVRTENIPRIVSLSYATPIYMQGAALQYMYDGYGKTFLDAYNNIPHVGHCHPKVVAAGQRQMAQLNTNTRYMYKLLNDYSARLLAKFPPQLNKVFFVNSGSEASDLAIRLARHYTGKQDMLVMEHGYHGHTQTAVSISHYKFNNPKGQGTHAGILTAPIPDTYRGEFKSDDPKAGSKYAQQAIEMMAKHSAPIAAFISEPVVGCGGQVALAPGYLQALYPEVRAQGGVCISDEVQVGFGRLGHHFWGFEAQEVVPDIVVLGKPMGNGHPMGAVVTTQAIADAFSEGVEFFSSFGGNPVSCAIGLAVLDVLEEEGLQQHALEVGEYYLQSLHQLAQKYPQIGDVRGSGLFIGVEFIQPDSQKPDTELAQEVKAYLRDQQILTGTDGPFDNVLKSKPPLCFSKQNVDQVVATIDQFLKQK